MPDVLFVDEYCSDQAYRYHCNDLFQNGCDVSDQGSLESKGDNKWVLAFIAIMLVVQGIAKSSRQPLSTIYVDNNAKREKTGFYIGMLLAVFLVIKSMDPPPHTHTHPYPPYILMPF